METTKEITGKPAKELPACPVETTLTLISNKWKVLILRDLMPGTKRFGELKNSIGHVTQKVLTAQLREMEANPGCHVELGRGIQSQERISKGWREQFVPALLFLRKISYCATPPKMRS